MFGLRTIFRNRKAFTNFISTSSVKNGQKSRNSGKINQKAESSETVQPLNASSTGVKRNGKIRLRKNYFQKPEPFQTDLFKKMVDVSAGKVAKDLGGDEDKTKQDLLDYIKTFEVLDSKNALEKNSVFRRKNSSFKRKMRERDSVHPNDISVFRNLMPLGAFSPEVKYEDQVELKTWNALEAENLKFMSHLAPRNHFEELIQWTNEGKLWHFPINNDQGLEEEAKVSFTEHIFLEQHLEPWCPKKGPLRKFMELVLIGLSKNPYLTVEEKKEHINWFENYFESKKKLLQELGAVGTTKELEVSSQESPEKESSS